jgi:hypothetical protein
MDNSALVASPPSPEYPPTTPEGPFPAIVVIIPELSILRILLLPESAIYTFPEESMVIP